MGSLFKSVQVFLDGILSIIPTAQLCLELSAKFLRMHFVPLSMSQIKMLKSTGPEMNPLRTPFVTSFHLDTEPLNTTSWLQPSKQFFTHQVVCLLYSSLFSSEIKMWHWTLSKALQKCRKMTSVSLCTNAVIPSEKATRLV